MNAQASFFLLFWEHGRHCIARMRFFTVLVRVPLQEYFGLHFAATRHALDQGHQRWKMAPRAPCARPPFFQEHSPPERSLPPQALQVWLLNCLRHPHSGKIPPEGNTCPSTRAAEPPA